MKFTSKTEYGLMCMIYMAKSNKDRVSIAEMTLKEKYPVAYAEKILQALRRAKLVNSRAGKSGGYSLTKAPCQISLKEIIEALEGSTFEAFCDPAAREDLVCNHDGICGMKPIWKRTKELLDRFYGSLTLELMARGPLEVQRRMRAVESCGGRR